MKNEIEPLNDNDAIMVLDWDPESFHKRVSELESNGYVARLDSYSVTADIHPETGVIIHIYSIEMNRNGQPAK